MPGLLDPRLHTPLINAGIGAGALLVGVFVLRSAGSDELRALRALPVVDARGLAARPAGTAVLLEGRLAARQPSVEAGLVLAQRQQAVGVTRPGTNDVRFSWEPIAATPMGVGPLVIETRTGPVTVPLADLRFRDPPRVVLEPATVVAGSLRLVGFAAGDTITVQGRVLDGAGAVLQAVEIIGGPRAAFLRRVAAGAAVPWVLGGLFGLLGLGMLAAGVIGWRGVART